MSLQHTRLVHVVLLFILLPWILYILIV